MATVKNQRTVFVPLDDLEDAPVNNHDHDDELLDESIGEYGLVDAPVVDERTGLLLGGHGRRDSLIRRRDAGEKPPVGVRIRKGVWMVPVQRGWASDNDDEAERVAIVLNRATERGGWIERGLAKQLERFAGADQGLKALGFDQNELDAMLARIQSPPVTDPAEPETAVALPLKQRTKPGDLWVLGDHRVVCGDSRSPDDVSRLLDGATVNLAVTSPPYAERRKYDETSGFKPIPPDEYVEWFAPIAANVAEHLADDGSWFVNIKPGSNGLDSDLYVMDLVLAHAREWGWHFVTEFCWERIGVPKSVTRRFKNGFEPIYQFARGPWKMRPDAVRHRSDNVPMSLGPGSGNTSRHDRQGGVGGVIGSDRRPRKRPASGPLSEFQGKNAAPGESLGSGMAYPSNRLPTFVGSHEATGHSAAFPVGLPQWFVRAYTDAGDVVYDPFMGSGSSILAAHNEARIGFGMEVSPAYCDVICARFERVTGIVPVRNGKRVSFA